MQDRKSMATINPKSIFLLKIIILCLYFFTIFDYYKDLLRAPEVWRIGEWLITYDPEIQRRFAVGHIFYFISKITSIKLDFLVFLFQSVVLLACSYLFIRVLLTNLQNNKLIFLLGVSPTLILFQFSGPGNFRKEILGYLASLFLINIKSNERIKYVFGVFIFLIFIFSWEAGLVFSPLIIHLINSNKNISTYFKKCLNTLIIIFSSFCIYLATKNLNTESSDLICEKILESNLSNKYCYNGAIDSLYWPISYIHGHLRSSFIQEAKYLYIAVAIFIFTYVYAIIVDKHIKIRYILVISPCFILFFVGFDYDRWVSIISMVSLIFLLSAKDYVKRLPFIIDILRSKYVSLVIVLSLFIGIPHVGIDSIIHDVFRASVIGNLIMKFLLF